jgi:hypothetical protein
LHRSPTFINQIIIARLSITIIIKNLFWNFSPFLHEFIFIQPPKKCKFEMLLHFLISIFQNCFCLVFIVNKQQWERRSKYLTFYFVNKSNAFDDYFSETKTCYTYSYSSNSVSNLSGRFWKIFSEESFQQKQRTSAAQLIYLQTSELVGILSQVIIIVKVFICLKQLICKVQNTSWCLRISFTA